MKMQIPKFIIPLLEIVFGLGAVILIVLWMSGTFRDKVKPDAPVQVKEAPVWNGASAVIESVTRPIIEQAAGTIQASRKTAVSSNIMAQILAIKVKAGDVVKAGDLIVQLDSRDLTARVEQSRQGVEAARATLDLAKTEYDRSQQLFNTGVLAQSKLDSARESLNVAQASYEKAIRAADETRVGLTYSEIKAPVSGRVVERLMEPGDTATPGQPILSLYDPQALQLEVPVRESLALSLKIGDALAVHIDASNTTLKGQISEIVPQAEAGARTFLVKVVLPDQENLFTGMFGRLLLPAGERRHLVAPEKAIERIGQLAFANVVDEQNRLHRRMVTTGQILEQGQVEVLSGLSAGEKVAVPEG